MADNEELDRIAQQLQFHQANGDAIRQQMQAMQANVAEINSAIDAISNIKKASKDVLLPIGAGAYLSCPKPDSDKVVISIGANVLVNKKPEEAVKLLQEREKSIGEAIKIAEKDMERVIGAIDELSQKASLLASGANQNVRASKE